MCVLFGCDYLDMRLSKELSDLEIYKLVKENDLFQVTRPYKLDNLVFQVNLPLFRQMGLKKFLFLFF